LGGRRELSPDSPSTLKHIEGACEDGVRHLGVPVWEVRIILAKNRSVGGDRVPCLTRVI